MINPSQLETSYKEFSQNLLKWIPDGVTFVNLNVLQALDLLGMAQFESSTSEQLMHYFHIIETSDKVTLFNDQFAIWIVPTSGENQSASTLTYIALLQVEKPHLEIVFSTSGVYNAPKYILRILQHFLNEVLDTEAVISAIGKKK